MIDTHCHLEKKDYSDIDNIIRECKEQGVEKIIVSGHNLESCKEALELAKKYNNVYATIGFLPDNIDNIKEEDFLILEEMLQNKKIVGVGEIGLDYYYETNNKDKQKELFIRQLKLAQKYNLPVVIHSRDSINDTYEILKSNQIKKGTMHCYSGSLEYANKFIDLGLYISIGGVSTFKNAKEIKKVIENISLNNILLETDSPYLTPEPYRGKKNYPYYIPLIAQNISKIKDINVERVKIVTTSNARSLFDI